MLTPHATLNEVLLYLPTRRTKRGSKSGDLILIRLLTGFLFIYLHLFILFIIFHFKIVGCTPLIMHWYSSLVTLSSIEIITFLVQLLIWHLEELYIIQISQLVGRTQNQKEYISLKKQKTKKTKTKITQIETNQNTKNTKNVPPLKKNPKAKQKTPQNTTIYAHFQIELKTLGSHPWLNDIILHQIHLDFVK